MGSWGQKPRVRILSTSLKPSDSLLQIIKLFVVRFTPFYSAGPALSITMDSFDSELRNSQLEWTHAISTLWTLCYATCYDSCWWNIFCGEINYYCVKDDFSFFLLVLRITIRVSSSSVVTVDRCTCDLCEWNFFFPEEIENSLKVVRITILFALIEAVVRTNSLILRLEFCARTSGVRVSKFNRRKPDAN